MMLLEFYDESFRISEEDGHVYDAQSVLGWLNYLFDEAYTNARVLDLWKIYRLSRITAGVMTCCGCSLSPGWNPFPTAVCSNTWRLPDRTYSSGLLVKRRTNSQTRVERFPFPSFFPR